MFVVHEAVMGINLIIVLKLWSLVQIVQCMSGTPFPACMDVNQKCGALGCKEAPIFMFSHARKYSSKNVFCFNNSPAVAMRPYRLTGCPTTYFNSLQNTSGICSITTEDNRTDLLLTTNELVTGLHSFDCLFSESPTGMVSSRVIGSAIAANAHAPYRDFFVNGVLQDDHNNITNITLQVGDDWSVVARAVGNVTVITADHDGSKFTCMTGFACNKHTRHDVSNWYLDCFLSSPAELSDSGKTLTISVDNMELKRFVITVIKRSSEPLISSPPDTEAEPTNTTPNITATISTTTVPSTTKEMDFIVYSSTPVIICVFILIVIVLGIVVYYVHTKWTSNHQIKSIHWDRDNEEGRIQDSCVEKEVFDTFYAKLVKILPVVDNIYNMLVPEGILVPDDIQEINSFPRSDHKATVVLRKINSSLQASKTDSFYRLLKVMDTSLNNDVKDLVNDMRRALLMTVFSLFCHHYKQLCDELTHYGYHMIKKVPTPSGNMSTTLFDQGIPLITSSCSECELPREVAELLRTPTMPDSWNILYLHQNGSGDVTQWNERIKVVHIDFNNGSVVEVLNWLSAKLPRRSSTSVGWRTTRYLLPTSELVSQARPFFLKVHRRRDKQRRDKWRTLRKKNLACKTTSEWRMIKSNVTTI